jgi:hypothetical protein
MAPELCPSPHTRLVPVTALESEMARDDTPQDNELDLEDDELDTDPAGQPTEDDDDAAGGADENDDDDDDDDGEPEPEDASGSQEPPAAARQPASRSGRQVSRLREERRAQAEELAALRREMAELRQTRQQAPPPQEDPRVEHERLALMSPEERMEYRLDKSLRAHQQQTSAMVFNMQQTQDKASWDARASGDKLRSKLAADVEREYQACIARGQYLPRENIYIYLVGQRFLSSRGKNPVSQKRVERERVRPSSGRGDVAQERRAARSSGTTGDFERRYGDVQI